MIEINREELAWAAGFFDGEGWVGAPVAYKGRGYARLVVGQTDPEPLERFHKAIGGLGEIQYSKNSVCKAGHWWKLNVYSFERVQAVSAMLWPFLSSKKRKQIVETLRVSKNTTYREIKEKNEHTLG